jgi:hypothetical protein
MMDISMPRKAAQQWTRFRRRRARLKMKHLVFAVTILASLCMSEAAYAAPVSGASTTPITISADPSTGMATLVCRPVQSGETATYTAANVALVCKPLDVNRMAQDMMQMTGGKMTPQQDGWRKKILEEYMLLQDNSHQGGAQG